MLAEIENKTLEWLEAAGLGIRAVDVTKDERVKRPAAFVYVEAGNFSRAAVGRYKCEAEVYVLIAFRSVRDELHRRHGLYPILEGVIRGLTLNALGLDITGLVPKRFTNITDRDFREDDTLVYQVMFTTSFMIAALKDSADETAKDLLRIGLNYYLQDPGDDGAADARDLIEKEEP